ncbi:MAG: class I SAM-dependent methyltransferase, partial [Gammaproteobacteria bacterium]
MVITSFSRNGYDEYGLEFIQTFLKHTDHDLTVYHEGLPEHAPADPRITYVNLTAQEHFLGFARKLYDADPMYSGAVMNGDSKAYNFRFDAFKFFRKVWALKHYDENRTNDDLIVWLDADITFTRGMPHDLFSDLLKDAYVAYIGRGGGLHSECGAMVFDPTHRDHGNFFELYWRIYETGAFRKLDEFHDSFVFDFIRDLVQPPEVNIGKGCDPVHPFVFTKLGLYMDHKKGPERKAQGHSPEANGQFSRPVTEYDLKVSNGGERQARPTMAQMKANHVERYKWASKQLNGAATVLDAACGVGYGSKLLAAGRDMVFAVDISEDAIAYGQQHYAADNVVFMQMDVTSEADLPVADAVVSLETIEHVPDSGALL